MWHSTLGLTLMASAVTVQADSLKDIKHIILFMQENRSFDHYFGTMAGVRNFGDPNVQVNDGTPVWRQSMRQPKAGVDYLSPWHINYLGGDWREATQCMGGGINTWEAMHGAYNNGRGDGWAIHDTDYSMGYYKREDVPTHWDIAEGWTVMDNSYQSILGLTDPNRVMWMSGTVNTAGSYTNPDGQGGNILSNRASPGCDSPGNNCFPFVWKTMPEYLEDAGISWQVWQDFDNFEDNMLAYFKQYQDAPEGDALRENGISFPGLQAFYDACAEGSLPQVSWVIGPQELSEHTPNMPIDGAWLQKKVVEAVTNSPAYKESALIISYDEQGGWADHVIPPVAPKDAPGEWITDPFNADNGQVPIGPGPRIPRFIVSPWTRGGHVFAETGDHTSDLLFLESWAAANGYDVFNQGISDWRRQHMTDMVNAFDFDSPDYSLPQLTEVRDPESRTDNNWSGNLSLGSLTGPWVGPARCRNGYEHGNYPPVPYGEANAGQNMEELVEDGFKQVRGAITEGRYITIESNGLSLGHAGNGHVVALESAEEHDDARQRWVLHAVDGNRFGNTFHLQSASEKSYVSKNGSLTTKKSAARAFIFEYEAQGSTYTLRAKGAKSGKYVSLGKSSKHDAEYRENAGKITWEGHGSRFEIYAVNYQS
ncbi:extracellular phospholipase C [Metarhizium anisopliae]